MRKLACVAGVIVLAGFALSASADEVAVTDFYNNGLVGGGQTKDLLTDPQSTVAAGIGAAAWTTGTDLTAVGTAASHCIWATGWENEDPNDYFALTIDLDAGYYLVFDQLRFMTRASSTGPTAAHIDVKVDGSVVWSHDYATMTSYNNQLIDVGVTTGDGAVVEVIWTGTGATSYQGSWRLGSYYDAGYYDSGILGTVVPEPCGLLLLGLGALVLRRR
jgi:hypothetical protein